MIGIIISISSDLVVLARYGKEYWRTKLDVNYNKKEGDEIKIDATWKKIKL